MVTTRPIDFRTNLKNYMDTAFRGETVIVSRPKNENVVLVSESEYNDLIKERENAEYLRKLDKSYEELKDGKTITLSLDELKNMESDDWKPSEKVKEFMGRMKSE